MNGATREPDAAAVLREINGYRVVDRAQVAGFQELKDALTCSLHKGRLANPGGSGRGQ